MSLASMAGLNMEQSGALTEYTYFPALPCRVEVRMRVCVARGKMFVRARLD